MPKLSKYEKGQLEKLLHEAVHARDKGKCRRCGSTTHLHASHNFPKGTYRKMRYNLDNLMLLCYRCHFHWWHKNPIEAAEWLKKEIGESAYQKLKFQANYVDKTPIDYKLIRIYLKAKIQEWS